MYMEEVIEKTEQQILEESFRQIVANFQSRWTAKGSPISPAGIWNYAMSVMRYEFHKKFDEDTAKYLVEQYKPK